MIDPKMFADVPDLGSIAAAGSEQAKRNREQILAKNGLLCPCGEKIRDNGVLLFITHEGLVSTDLGQQAAFTIATVTFHDRHCPVLEKVLPEMQDDPAQAYKPICIRKLPPVEWIEERTPSASDGDRSE